ncbi:MAG: sodium:solute symporter family transporter [Planctomycetota bacterium]
MSILDWCVLAAYVVCVIAIGARAARRSGDVDGYFLGGRNLSWVAAGFSILATSFSAASILGVPGTAFGGDFWYLQLQLGDLLAAAAVCALFIPFFHRMKLTSAYEYLEARFDLKTRLLGSALFSLSTLLRAATLLFGAAILAAAVAPTDVLPGLTAVEEAVVLFGGAAIIYTLLGGIAAVVWTDVLQCAVMAVGVIACVALAMHGSGGPSVSLQQASEAGRLKIFHFDASAAFTTKGIITAIFGYGLLALALFGTNQQPVQRYMTVKDVGAARRALMLGVGSGAIGVTLSLLLGAVLFVYYQNPAHVLPEGLTPDGVVPYFIRTEVPSGLKGLLVSAVFAAAMSSLDSALNSLSAAFVTDWYVRLRPAGRGAPSQAARLRVARACVLVAGIVGIVVGISAARTESGLIELILKFMGYFAGGVLALFLLGMLSRRATGTGAFVGAIAGTAFALCMSKAPPLGLPELWRRLGVDPVPSLWLTAASLAVAVPVGLLISRFVAAPTPKQLAWSLHGGCPEGGETPEG